MRLQVGNVVQLASGGPKMTVDSVKHNVVKCMWFFGDNLRDGNFSQEALEVVKLPEVVKITLPPHPEPYSTPGFDHPIFTNYDDLQD